MARPDKLAGVLGEVRARITAGQYGHTLHSSKRQAEREIFGQEILYVLNHGHHEPGKVRFDAHYRQWNYAIRGRTVEQRELRIIVTFDADGLVIVTAMELNPRRNTP